MFGSEIIDVVIGLIFVYIVVSVICTAVREGIEAWLKTRAAYLEHGIRQLLHDKAGTGLAADVFKHPLIFSLFTSETYKPGPNRAEPTLVQRGGGLPSYIPSKNFARALLDIAAHGPMPGDDLAERNAPPISLASIRRNVSQIGNPSVQRIILSAVDTAQGDLDKAQKTIEDWFDSGMDRVSGWYKRSTQKIILVIGTLIAVSMNIDSIAVVGELYKTDAARAAAVAAAGNAKENMSLADATSELKKLKLPIGWEKWSWSFACPPNFNAWLQTFFFPWIGWFITAIAASLGAPFWFDMLNKVMVIRSTVKPREKSPEEGSEDRQNAPAPAPAPPPAPAAAPAPAALNATADDTDGCDVLGDATSTPTADNQLPAAEGGVA